jgi:hypothetical protein
MFAGPLGELGALCVINVPSHDKTEAGTRLNINRDHPAMALDKSPQGLHVVLRDLWV